MGDGGRPEKQRAPGRPWVVTGFCLVAAASELYGAFRLASNSGAVPLPRLIAGFVASAALFAGLYGTWTMRRWGPLLYLLCYIYALSSFPFRTSAGQVNLSQLVLLGWIAFAALATGPYYKRFD